jgi:hypothetical protein
MVATQKKGFLIVLVITKLRSIPVGPVFSDRARTRAKPPTKRNIATTVSRL